MRAVIVYQSVHHQNTAKVAVEIAQTLKSKSVPVSKFSQKEISNYDLVGFGSGIYFGRFHRALFKFVQKIPDQKNKKTFLFSTSGIPKISFAYDPHRSFRQLVKAKGFNLVGEFNCLGWDTYPFFVRPFGGLWKNRPNQKDLLRAKSFAFRLKKLTETKN